MNKTIKPLTILLCAVLASCAAKPSTHTKTIYAMDTVMTITAYWEDDSPLEAAQQELMRLDSLMSRGEESSEVYRINESEKTTITEETEYVLTQALEISALTDGAFDITIAPLMDAWGFYNRNFQVPDRGEIFEKMEAIGYEKLLLEDGALTKPKETKIDLGGIGKGYASDRTVQILKKEGISSAIISLGGNIYALGKKPDNTPWRIAVQNPFDADSFIGSISVKDKAVITSGGYERYFETDGRLYHHIIDPSTGYPAESGLSSVTVISDSSIRADALSTAMFVMGLEKSAALWKADKSFGAVFVTDSGEIFVTENVDFESEREFSVLK